MTSSAPTTLVFPAPRLAAYLTLAALVSAVFQLSALPSLVTSADPGICFKVIVFVNAAAWYAFMMSIVPIMVLNKIGPHGFMWGYFSGLLTRFVAALAVAFLMVKLALMPANLVAISLVITYTALLATDAVVLHRYLTAKAAAAPVSAAKPRPTEALS